MQAFKAQGKLMLTGEYFVLDGAVSLAMPTVYGQRMEVVAQQGESLHWHSIDKDGNVWLDIQLPLSLEGKEDASALETKLLELLRAAREMNPSFLNQGASVKVMADFDLQWGLGSSSTLVSLLAQWAGIDPYALQFQCFGGSGYDIACATADGPILYEKLPSPKARSVNYAPAFSHQLHFVYLGKKQNSREGIQYYRSMGAGSRKEIIERLNAITQAVLEEDTLSGFCQLLKDHEALVGEALKLNTVQMELFPDFNGVVKSLGAWGGDFVLAASSMESEELRQYFHSKGHSVVVPYNAMLL